MTDHLSFLDAIEADPSDDTRWLVYADWLEEQGDPLAPALRSMAAEGTWNSARVSRLNALKGRQLRLFACDCLERVLPAFEERFPDDPTPRRMIEVVRQFVTGKRVDAAKQAVSALIDRHRGDAIRDPNGYEEALATAWLACKLTDMPSFVCLNSAYRKVAWRLGLEAHRSQVDQMKPDWVVVRDAEFRWQLARLLRYQLPPRSGP